jgi:hypothetical protein
MGNCFRKEERDTDALDTQENMEESSYKGGKHS